MGPSKREEIEFKILFAPSISGMGLLRDRSEEGWFEAAIIILLSQPTTTRHNKIKCFS